jgi:DegV family protein with EDD domain
LSVIFGDDVYREGIEITPDLFYDKLSHVKDLPTTSAPSVGDFLEVYREKLKKTDEIVSIHLSSKLSATYSNACQAAAQLADEGARIDVFDSQTVSYGAQFLVTTAARAAASVATVEEIRKALDGMVERIHVYIVLDTLEYVRRGGRIGRARAFLGTVLRVKPILSIHHGEGVTCRWPWWGFRRAACWPAIPCCVNGPRLLVLRCFPRRASAATTGNVWRGVFAACPSS